jgi:hypothetical protein
MREEREFWVIENVPTRLMKGDDPLLSTRSTPSERSAYPVFESRVEAERFAGRNPNIVGSTLQELLKNIRKIEPNEIAQDHDVLLNGDKDKRVKWSELTGDDAPPVT